MHKILLATIIFCSSFLFVPALHAETSTGKVGDDNSQKIQQELEARREEQRQKGRDLWHHRLNLEWKAPA